MKTVGLAIGCLFVSLSAHAVGISGQGTWETTLQARDLDGNLTTAEAYYDTVLGITWLADANYSGIRKDWGAATIWASELNPYGSNISGWRLPVTNDVGNDGQTYTNIYQGVDFGYNITSHSEMSHMFYVTLGDLAYYDVQGNEQNPFGLSNTGPFANIQGFYWSATEISPTYIGSAWSFDPGDGSQRERAKITTLYAWAVHDGDVGTPIVTSAVPLPAGIWLLGSGVLSLLGICNKRFRHIAA